MQKVVTIKPKYEVKVLCSVNYGRKNTKAIPPFQVFLFPSSAELTASTTP